jgi:hypothetical protein
MAARQTAVVVGTDRSAAAAGSSAVPTSACLFSWVFFMPRTEIVEAMGPWEWLVLAQGRYLDVKEIPVFFWNIGRGIRTCIAVEENAMAIMHFVSNYLIENRCNII